MAFALQLPLCNQNAGVAMNSFLKANVEILPSAMLKARVGGDGQAKKGDDYNKNRCAGKVWLVSNSTASP